MDRKEFIKKSCTGVCVALGSGFIMSAFLQACKTPLSVVKTKSDHDKVTIPLADFAQGNYKLVRVSNYNYDLAVQKNADGTFMALVLKCTHAAQPLTRTGNGFYCTLHGSQFSKAGAVVKGPADKPMIELPVTVTNEAITIKLDNTI